jgi:hypothetical protein
MPVLSPRFFRLRSVCLLLASVGALSACASLPGSSKGLDTHESFDSDTTYSRAFAALDAQTCEAARRALLSQGYVIDTATADLVRGRKSFQPTAESHIEIQFYIVCAKEGSAGKRTIAFVNAVQDRYALKKSNNSASLGVGVLGSVSLPFSSSDDSLVKVASATITTGKFYDRFFTLVERYLNGDSGQPIAQVAEPVELPELPVPAIPVPAAASAPTAAAPAASAASAN